MTTEGVVITEVRDPGLAEADRQRAIRSLLGVAQRMNYLVEPFASGKFDGSKVAGELGGMAAWIEAFTCQLAGLPIQLTPAVGGELMLATLEVSLGNPLLVDAVAALPSEGETARGAAEDAASRRAAIALSLTSLAMQILLGGESTTEVGEVAIRHREAELRLFERLQAASHAYFHTDLDPNTYVPELSAHGMPEDG